MTDLVAPEPPGQERLIAVLSDVLPDYEVPEDNLVGEVLIPAMRVVDEVRVGAGFFTSHCLAQIAPGLAAFIRGPGHVFRLLISPEISDEDRAAIEAGVRSPQDVLEAAVTHLLDGASVSESALVQHTLECLSYLVASERLEVRFVLMRRGMYHKKKWLFREGGAWAAVHGSGNATTRGLLVNGEQMTIDRPWMDGPSVRHRVERLVAQWDRQWNNKHPSSLTLTAPQGLRFAGRRRNQDEVPTVEAFWEAWRKDHESGLEPELPPGISAPPKGLLAVPPEVEWRSGRFGHQGRAVDSFLGAEARGIMSIATGGGKTKCALIAATELQEQHEGPLLVFILVPSRPLLLQWADDIRDFGVEPILPSFMDRGERSERLKELEVALNLGERRTEVILATTALFVEDRAIRELLGRLAATVRLMLVGDEVHNLGAPKARASLPERADARLGLSATPIRQYDPDGTDELFDYFGHEVFEFSLSDAIEAGCLAPYRYHLHEVSLDSAEMEKWLELTEELWKAGFKIEDDGRTVIPNGRVERLLRQRRAVLEQAEGKLMVLKRLLQDAGPRLIRRCLIYTSAKPPVVRQVRQIEEVNSLLSHLGIVSHQFTNAETSRAESARFLDAFAAGDYQVLTAMKVLDEGIDIPQTDTAFILASSTVRREWVQRRGRILRLAPGKEAASLHDFLVLPPDTGSRDGAPIIKSELRRAEEFASASLNEWETGGPRSVISKYEDLVWASG